MMIGEIKTKAQTKVQNKKQLFKSENEKSVLQTQVLMTFPYPLFNQ